jgi:hypothetical protein
MLLKYNKIKGTITTRPILDDEEFEHRDLLLCDYNLQNSVDNFINISPAMRYKDTLTSGQPF